MLVDGEDNEPGKYASPACFMHELDAAYMEFRPPSHLPFWTTRWRKEERQRLINARRALSSADRGKRTTPILVNLDGLLADVRDKSISTYRSFRGEHDLLERKTSLSDRSAVCFLPVFIERKIPLGFRSWWPGEKPDRGIWDIPIPISGKEMAPDLVIAPMVGFDEARFRHGYGGGYFNRTVAVRKPAPRTIGVGFELQQVSIIHPLTHDIPMDAIVKEPRVRFRRKIERYNGNIPFLPGAGR